MDMVMYVPESKTFLLVESEIMGFGIPEAVLGIRIPASD